MKPPFHNRNRKPTMKNCISADFDPSNLLHDGKYTFMTRLSQVVTSTSFKVRNGDFCGNFT